MTREKTIPTSFDRTPSVLLLGGSAQMTDFIKEIRRLKLRLVVVDKNPNCALARAADFFINVDCRDAQRIVESLGHWQQSIFAVLTFSELTESVAQVCDSLRLPGADRASAALFQSKIESKKLFKARGVPTPQALLASQIDWQTLSPRARFAEGRTPKRWVLKPTSGSGGREISFHPTLMSCIEAWAKKERRNQWLAEHAVEGIHIDVNAFIDSSSEFVRLGLSQRTFGGSGSREESVETPPQINDQLADEIYRAVEKGARAAGVSFGPLKADVVATGQGVFVLEMATRLHGPKLSVTAFSHVYRNYFDVILSLYWEGFRSAALLETFQPAFQNGRLVYSGKVFLSVALTKPEGRVQRLSRKIPFLNSSGLPRVVIFVGEDDLIEPDGSRESAIGFVYGAFEDRDLGSRRVRRIREIAERGILISRPNDSCDAKEIST